MNAAQSSAVAKFRALHESGCFVLPNPWDVGTAVYCIISGLRRSPPPRRASPSSCGKSDGRVLLDDMLSHIGEMVAATPLPVNADFLNGFADEPENVAGNVERCIATGVAGLSIEDNTGRGDVPLYEKGLAVERIRAARRAIDASGVPERTRDCSIHLDIAFSPAERMILSR